MRTTHNYSRLLVFAVLAIGTGVVLGFMGWPAPNRTLEFSGLIFAAILIGTLSRRQSTAVDQATMSPSCVIEFAALLLLGPNAATLVAAVAAVAYGLGDSRRSLPYHRLLVNAASGVAAIQAAGFAHGSLGGTLGHFVWPWQGLPIAAAVAAYCIVHVALADIVVPLLARQPFNRKAWLKHLG